MTQHVQETNKKTQPGNANGPDEYKILHLNHIKGDSEQAKDVFLNTEETELAPPNAPLITKEKARQVGENADDGEAEDIMGSPQKGSSREETMPELT